MRYLKTRNSNLVRILNYIVCESDYDVFLAGPYTVAYCGVSSDGKADNFKLTFSALQKYFYNGEI